jgi:glutamyl-tRNA synthetase
MAALEAMGSAAFEQWLGDKTRQLPTDALRELAEVIGVTLPEIDVDDFRRSGYLPEVLLNYVALLGWNPGGDVEKFDLPFICEKFDLDRLNKANSKFDRVKLLSFNQDALAAMGDAEFERRWRGWCELYAPRILEKLGDRFPLAARAAKPRAKTLADAAGPVAFALVDDNEIASDEKAVEKVLRAKPSGAGVPPVSGPRGTGVPPVSGAEVLRELRPVIKAIDPFEPEQIEAAVKQFAEQRGLGMGKVAQPLRVAITGTTVSPGLGETLALVGRSSVLVRIDRAIT